MVVLAYTYATAQPVLTPRNVALGGGGSTYITDYNANFYNPANLLIQDRPGRIDIGALITGTYFNGVQNFSDLNDQRENLESYVYAYDPSSYAISPADRAEILEDNYIRNRRVSRHQTRLDLTLLGVRWRQEDRAFSIALRNRISSSFEVGRGWYSSEPQSFSETPGLDRTLNHRYQSLFEISLGYAETFRFFTDMTPRLDKFSFGIAPKLVLGGAYQFASFSNTYEQLPGGNTRLIQALDYKASGTFGAATSQYLSGTPVNTALNNNINDALFDPYGIGAGIDIGITYLITLGDDLSTLQNVESSTRQSLRLSFSITDIGIVHYKDNNKVISLSSAPDTVSVSQLPQGEDLATDAFVGAPGQFLSFTDQFALANPLTSANRTNTSFSVLLPTSLHAGILVEINRFKLTGDLSLGLRDNAFNSTKLVASAGIEVRPFHFLPLRAGTQLATELPNYFSFGTAIETKYWDLSVATQFISRTFSDSPTLTGVTVAALQFHF